MWPFRTSRNSGIWRSFSLASSALVCFFASFSTLAATCYSFNAGENSGGAAANSGPMDTPGEAAQWALNYCNSNPTVETCNGGFGCGATCVYSGMTLAINGTFPSYKGTFNVNGTCAGSPCSEQYTVAVGGTALAQCAACPAEGTNTLYGLDALPPSGSGLNCYGGCVYTAPTTPFVVSCSAASGACSSGAGVVEASSTGQACGQSAATSSTTQTQAADNASGGAGASGACDPSGTVCASPSGVDGSNCGEYNGDQVCVSSIKPGTCVSYASGGMACSSTATQPGTSAGSDTPAMQVTQGSQTVDYYTPAQVASNTKSGVSTTNPVQSLPTGSQGVGSGGSGGSGGSVTVTNTVSIAGAVSVVPNAANGDCGASGVNCAGTAPSQGGGSDPGDGPTTWSGDCTSFSNCLSNFYSSIQGAPLVAGAAAIETAWPSGTCDIGSVSLATFNNQSFNYGTTACTVWTDYIQSPLSAILLVVYAVAGIFIVLSA